LINRIEEILRTPELTTIFHPTPGPSAFEAIEKLVTDQSVAILRISLEYLPTTHRVREIVVNALARHVLHLGRSGMLANRPVVAVLDEAHQVLAPRDEELDRSLPVDAFHIIAKEGRKYGITLCLATQRPRDIPDDVLSQVGTFIVHRLIGSTDRNAIETASGSLDEEGLSNLATLGSGEALLLGAGIRDARRIKVLPPITPPISRGPDYQRAWRRVTTKAE
jgi:DNA helicase HerA-like ATPase